jgi:hypothetical protein
VAGALIALPNGPQHDLRLGQAILSGLGLFLVAMAVLQAWPGRVLAGDLPRAAGTLVGMTHGMAQTPARFPVRLVSAFTRFDEAHGFWSTSSPWRRSP